MLDFDEVEIPLNIDLGTRGSTGFAQTFTQTEGGNIGVVSRGELGNRTYDVSATIRNRADAVIWRRFFVARRGGERGFRFKDPDDFTTNQDGYTAPTAVDCVIGGGDGSKTVFQCVKVVEDPAAVAPAYVWPITKVVASSFLLAIDGTPTTLAAAGATLNANTGELTFNTAPAAGVSIAIGCEYRIPVIFGPEAAQAFEVIFRNIDRRDFPSMQLLELGQSQTYSTPVEGHGSVTANNPGGFVAVSFTQAGLWISDDATTTGWTLPNPAGLAAGKHGAIFNSGANTKSIRVVSSSGAFTSVNLGPGDTAEVWLDENVATQVYRWVILKSS